MRFICPKCKAEYEIQPKNEPAQNIIYNYEHIDPTRNISIELLCNCKTPLTVYHDYLKYGKTYIEKEIKEYYQTLTLKQQPQND